MDTTLEKLAAIPIDYNNRKLNRAFE